MANRFISPTKHNFIFPIQHSTVLYNLSIINRRVFVCGSLGVSIWVYLYIAWLTLNLVTRKYPAIRRLKNLIISFLSQLFIKSTEIQWIEDDLFWGDWTLCNAICDNDNKLSRCTCLGPPERVVPYKYSRVIHLHPYSNSNSNRLKHKCAGGD
jgi:hypothetical protein